MMQERSTVFISYSHKDRTSFEDLKTHLTPYLQNALIDSWDDTEIEAGANWRDEIAKALARAKVGVLLVSPTFLSSHFIQSIELPTLLKAAEQEGVTILWVPLIACAVEETLISKLQSPLRPPDPIGHLPPAKRSEKWEIVCKAIKKALQQNQGAQESDSLPTAEKPGIQLASKSWSTTQTQKSTSFEQPLNSTVEVVKQIKPRRLIYEQVPVQGLLAFDDLSHPYEHLQDPTDPEFKIPLVYGYASFPHTNYLISGPLQEYTPVAVVCALNPEAIVQQLREKLGEENLKKFAIQPRNLRNEEKRALLTAMGGVLDDCFEVAVTFSKLTLEFGRVDPKHAYGVMVNGFLLPFIQLHQRIGLDRFCFKFGNVGEENKALLTHIKKAFNVCFRSRRSKKVVDIGANDPVTSTMISMARLFGWAVGRLHNPKQIEEDEHPPEHWISVLEEALNEEHRDPSHLEGSL